MGIGVADFDGDGWSDVFVANDTVPSFLFMNHRNGTFSESAFERGVALPDRGEPVAGMGVDARDVDGDGRPDVFLTALTGDTFPLFHNQGGAAFEDATARTGVGDAHAALDGLGQRDRRPEQRRLARTCSRPAPACSTRAARPGARVPMPNAVLR